MILSNFNIDHENFFEEVIQDMDDSFSVDNTPTQKTLI